MPWSKIGGPAHSLAIIANRLAALTPDKQAVYMRDPSSGQWQQIGGPAASLVGGAWDLYATSPGSGDLWRYDGSTWTMGKFKEAIKAEERAIRLEPNNARAHFSLALAYLRLGNKDAALKQYSLLKTMNGNWARQLYQNLYSDKLLEAEKK
jgi:tetratricopeptide (TPR) repeat protein